MKEPQAAVDITRREVLRSWAGTVVGGCFAGLLLAGLCAGAETQARQPSAPPDSGIQDGAVRPIMDWADAMASVPSDPAQWPSAMPPGEVPKQKPDPTALILTPIGDRFPLECDWFLQDWAPRSPADWWLAADRRAATVTLFERAVQQLPEDRAAAFRQTLRSAGETTVESVLRLYQQIGRERRQQRLAALFARCPRIVFTKFQDQGQGYAPRPAVSDGRGGGFAPGGELGLLEFDGSQLHTRTLVDSPQGMIRDPDVSFDGQRILFAWRKDAGDDFHLYHYELADGQIRQLTAGKGFADYQGKYLPDGGIVFSSTRCVQTSDCIDIDVSNLYYVRQDGGRELLATDPRLPCTQPVPLAARQRPPAIPSRVDDHQRTGLVHLQDIYYGAGRTGVRRGAIKRLRVVALDYRAAAIGMGQTNGPAGGVWNVRTPVAINGIQPAEAGVGAGFGLHAPSRLGTNVSMAKGQSYTRGSL